MNRISLYLILVLTGALAGCSGNSSSPAETISQESDSGSLSGLSVIAIPSNLEAAARAYLFDYTMESVTGDSTVARAQLFEPAGVAPEDGYPLVVWAHGTTGIANACAPSNSFEIFGNAVAVNSLLTEGYAVLAPDYEGFGTPDIHPYFIRSSHANSVLASLPAAHRIEGTNLSDDWAIVGHSQGGHVALAAARAPQHAAYPLQAVAALAPGTDLMPVSDRIFEAIDLELAEGMSQIAAERTFYLNVYGAYIAHAVQTVEPSFDPKSIFGDTISALIDSAVDEARCGDYADAVATALNNHVQAGGTLAEFGGLIRNWYEVPAIANRINGEELGDEAQSAPLLVVQGDADRQIPVAATTAFVDRQRSLGTDITYEVIAGGRHGDVARADFGRTIEWLAQRFPPR